MSKLICRAYTTSVNLGCDFRWIAKYVFAVFISIVFQILFANASLATSPPTISPGYGVFPTTTTVSMSASGGASIYYTTDGTTPTTSSTHYTGSISVSTSELVQAIAVLSGVSSSVTSAYIQIDPMTANVPQGQLALWYKADNGVSTSGSNVTQWLDMSPNATTASQATSTAQPTLTTNAINGLPAISFNGTSQFLHLGSPQFGGNGTDIFIVTKPTAVTAGARFFDFGNGPPTPDNIYVSEPTNTGVSAHIYNQTTDSSVTSSNAVTLNQYQLLEINQNSSGIGTIYTNGVQGASGSLNNYRLLTRSGNYIGTDYANTLFFEGQIAEILVYHSTTTASQRLAVQGYLAARYALFVDPPVISPAYGVFSSTKSVSMSADPGASIYYTTDGSTPTTSSTHYTGSFNVTSSKTIKAIAVQSFGTSTVSSAFIQIDSSVANIPQSFLSLWLKADNGVSTSGSNVTQWLDMSTNANNAVQSNSSNQPTFVSNAVNGLPAVDFSGSSQYLQLGSAGLSSFSGTNIFLVTEPTGAATNARLFEFANASGNDIINMLQPTSTGLTVSVSNGGGAGSLTASTAVVLNQFQLLEAAQNGSNSGTLYANESQVASGSLSNIPGATRSNSFIGSDYANSVFFQGRLAEMLVFKTALGSTDRTNVEAYLVSRYAISVNPPTITPAYGVFSSTQSVSMTADPGATIHYTTDGTTPTTSSPTYSGAFNVTTSTTVKAIAVQPFGSSAVASAYLQIDSNSSLVTRDNLKLWLKSDNGVTLSGSNVSQWQDMSTSGTNATQSSSGAQPGFVTNAVNGLPALTFNGTSQYLQLPSGFTNYGTGMSAFIVTKPTAVATNARFYDFANGEASDYFRLLQPNNTDMTFSVNNGADSSSLTSTNSVNLGQYQLLEVTENSTGSANMYANGQPGASGTIMTINNSSKSGNFIGSDYNNAIFFQGQIAEFLLYQTPLSTTARENLEAYMFRRYEFAIGPPIITPSTGVYSSGTVTMYNPDPDATIYYTTDGSTPTTSSTQYTGPFTLTSSAIVKAIAQTLVTSTVATSYIQIDPNSGGVPRSGLALWLRSDFGALTSGSNVTRWVDMSGSGNDGVQTNSPNQPILSSNAINGYPSVTFDGSSQYLQLGSSFSNLTSGVSTFTVLSPSGGSGYIVDVGNGATSDNVTVGNSSSGTTASLTVDNGSSSSTLNASSALTLNQYQLLETLLNTGTSSGSILVNGVLRASGALNTPNNISRTANHVGTNYNASSNFFQGGIAESLFYNRLLTTSEQAAVFAYLTQKYQLASLTPSAPIISLAGGTLSKPASVAIYAQPSATVYYTLDGSTPTRSSAIYAGPINIYYSQTLKAIAVLGGLSSGVTSASYTLDSTQYPAPSPTDTTPLNIFLQLPTTAAPQ